jgi:hypothetical protein
MFAANKMDGKLKVISPAALLQKGGDVEGSLTSIVPYPKDEIPEEYFVECQYGVMDAEYIQVPVLVKGPPGTPESEPPVQ